VGAGEDLIATAASAIAAPWIAWIARAVECGIIAAQPTGDDPTLGRGIIAPAKQEAVAWRAPICAAVLQTRHQQVANQRCTADGNCECRHLACHDCLSGTIAAWRFIVHRKSARDHGIFRGISPSRSLIVQAQYGTFAGDGPLYPPSFPDLER
jgi:hypothetical protein